MTLMPETNIQLAQNITGDIRKEDLHFFNSSEASTLNLILKQPQQFFIELGEYIHLSKVQDQIRDLQPDFCMSLTSESAFKQPVSEFLTHYLDKHLSLTRAAADNIKTCLQEAIANAVIHGNLNVHPTGNSAKNFKNYFDEILHRLKDPELAMYRVSILAWYESKGLTVCVSDQGKGFRMPQTEPEMEALHGRGLELMRAMPQRMWQTFPNHVYMKFVW